MLKSNTTRKTSQKSDLGCHRTCSHRSIHHRLSTRSLRTCLYIGSWIDEVVWWCNKAMSFRVTNLFIVTRDPLPSEYFAADLALTLRLYYHRNKSLREPRVKHDNSNDHIFFPCWWWVEIGFIWRSKHNFKCTFFEDLVRIQIIFHKASNVSCMSAIWCKRISSKLPPVQDTKLASSKPRSSIGFMFEIFKYLLPIVYINTITPVLIINVFEPSYN